MKEVKVQSVPKAELQSVIQTAKDNGEKVLALCPEKWTTSKARVTHYTLVTQ